MVAAMMGTAVSQGKLDLDRVCATLRHGLARQRRAATAVSRLTANLVLARAVWHAAADR